MKDNIREEKDVKYLKEEIINNDLLLYIYDSKKKIVYVKIRFIDNKQIIEHYVARLTMEEYLEGDRIVFNEDKTALAVFKKDNNQEVLVNFYNLEEHNCECGDFLDCAYNLSFNDKVDDYLRLVKKK